MDRRRVLQAGCLVWAGVGAIVSLAALGDVNPDARVLVGAASIVGPLLAVGAALALSRRADRTAGILLILSAVLTPTYFAYALNVPALIVGFVLAIATHRALPQSAGTERSEFAVATQQDSAIR